EPPDRLSPSRPGSARRDLQRQPVDHRRRLRRNDGPGRARPDADESEVPARARDRFRICLARRAARLPRRGLSPDALPARRLAGAEGDDGRPRRLLRDRRGRDRLRPALPDLRQRWDADRDRAGHRDPTPDGQRGRVVDGREPARDRGPAGGLRARTRPRASRPLVIGKTKTKSKLPVKPAAVLGMVKELRAGARREQWLVVSGAKELVGVLRRELVRGGVAAAVREQDPLQGAAALVYVLAGAPDADDEKVLKEAARKRVPIVAVVAGANVSGSVSHVPYV